MPRSALGVQPSPGPCELSERRVETRHALIKGIGKVTKETLLKAFKSVKRISETGLEELAAEIGKAKAQTVYNWFHK